MSNRVMVVEDDRSHRETLDRHLSRSGYDTAAFESAESALNAFTEFEPEIIINDIRMPGLSGLDLLRRVRESTPDIDVIVITGFDAVQAAIDAMKEGAYEYLVKPLDLDGFEDVVARCTEDRRRRVEAGEESDSPLPSAPGGELVGRHSKMLDVYKKIGSVAGSSATVLIRGETGTGKELIARTIHANSPRSSEPFVPLDCTAIPEALLESELFGHVRGAFTGASRDRKGRFELAGKGTIFLDEIGDMSPASQAKLLRVLQEREFFPVGAETPRRTEARVLTATHRPLRELVDSGEFREDLFFRLEVVEIHVPPLRERRSDIPLLASYFLRSVCEEMDQPIPTLVPEVMAELMAYEWPGNVRELENTITRAAVLCRGRTITPEIIRLGSPEDEPAPSPSDDETLESMERRHVQRVLVQAEGNKSRAARMLDISRPRLDRMIDRHELVVNP